MKGFKMEEQLIRLQQSLDEIVKAPLDDEQIIELITYLKNTILELETKLKELP